jgi:hypothetical protein
MRMHSQTYIHMHTTEHTCVNIQIYIYIYIYIYIHNKYTHAKSIKHTHSMQAYLPSSPVFDQPLQAPKRAFGSIS